DLRPAVEAGLVTPLTGLESLDADAMQSPLVYGRFAFRHDRVQQAAYATLPEGERPGLHLAIGRAWLAMTPVAELESRLFDIIGHLNQGRALMTDDAERLKLAELNRRAGTKARDSTAYALAVRSFEIAIELEGARAWKERYTAHFDAHRRLAEALSLTADAVGALQVIDRSLAHAATLTDRTHMSAIKTNVLLGMGRIPEALATGRAAAREFGIDLPEQPEQVRALLQREIHFIRERAAAVGIEKLLDLPNMDDPAKLALMILIAHCLPAAFQSDQESYALLCCTMFGCRSSTATAHSLRARTARSPRCCRARCASTRTPIGSPSSAWTSRTSSTRRPFWRACTSCSQCSHRTGSSRSTRASTSTKKRCASAYRAVTTCTPATASRGASRTCRCAARRSRTCATRRTPRSRRCSASPTRRIPSSCIRASSS